MGATANLRRLPVAVVLHATCHIQGRQPMWNTTTLRYFFLTSTTRILARHETTKIVFRGVFAMFYVRPDARHGATKASPCGKKAFVAAPLSRAYNASKALLQHKQALFTTQRPTERY